MNIRPTAILRNITLTAGFILITAEQIEANFVGAIIIGVIAFTSDEFKERVLK